MAPSSMLVSVAPASLPTEPTGTPSTLTEMLPFPRLSKR
jgi:hypothetical protein